MRRSERRARIEARAIRLSDREFLLPVFHPSRKRMRELERLLRSGQTFHVKSVGDVDSSVAGGYVLFAKLRKAEPANQGLLRRSLDGESA